MKAGKGGLTWASSQCSPLPSQVTDGTFQAIKIHVCESVLREQGLETQLPC